MMLTRSNQNQTILTYALFLQYATWAHIQKRLFLGKLFYASLHYLHHVSINKFLSALTG